MSYGVNPPDLDRRTARYIDKSFKRAKPANLAIKQPTEIELVINLRTARALGNRMRESVRGL